MGLSVGIAQNRPTKHLIHRRQSFRGKTGRAGRGAWKALHSVSCKLAVCRSHSGSQSLHSNGPSLKKPNEGVQAAGVGRSPGVCGGEGNNLGEKLGFGEGSRGSLDFSVCPRTWWSV